MTTSEEFTMSELTLFQNSAIAKSDLFQSLMDTTKALMGGGGGMRRISIKGGRFREIVGGQQVNVNSSGSINVVIVNAAAISRTYYAGAYDPDTPAAPTCWSTDTNTPAAEVPANQRQAARCADCKMNIKGSGAGESRACRFNQRLAVVLEGQYDTVYQLQLPATSVFGEAKDGKMPMQAYAKYLHAHNAPAIAIVTQVYFDVNAETPKLFFKAVRPLEEAELKEVLEAKDSDDAIKAITLTVAQTDGVQATTKTEAKVETKAEPKAAPKEEATEEPMKIEKKSAPAPKSDDDLADIVDAWDD
jgi:hypothetical protein